MRIGIDTTACSADLDKHIKEMTAKLEGMVARAASKLAAVASDNTPIGDPEALEERPSYRSYYEQRFQKYGIAVEVGFHAGAWVYTETSAKFDSNIYEAESVEPNSYKDASTSYQLGETFYIAASGPGYRMLENGYSAKAPQGISKPTVEQIIDIYKMNLQSYYK